MNFIKLFQLIWYIFQIWGLKIQQSVANLTLYPNCLKFKNDIQHLLLLVVHS